MNKKIMAFFIVGTVLLIGAGMVYASPGHTEEGSFDYMGDMHNTMQKAFDTADYELWSKTMSENSMHPRSLDTVTEENFNVFTDAHNAMMAGNFDETRKLRESIGFSMSQGLRQGQMFGNGNCPNH